MFVLWRRVFKLIFTDTAQRLLEIGLRTSASRLTFDELVCMTYRQWRAETYGCPVPVPMELLDSMPLTPTQCCLSILLFGLDTQLHIETRSGVCPGPPGRPYPILHVTAYMTLQPRSAFNERVTKQVYVQWLTFAI